ncbi:MAG: hypothetical protein AAF529_14295 [Pseudomonadota bacterium]
MDRDNYLEGIRGAWLGELYGEAFFNAMAQRSDDAQLRQKWLTLARLEQLTGQRMAQVLAAHGESTVPTEAIEVGPELIDRYANVPHSEALLRFQDVVDKAVIKFDQLLAITPEEDVAAVKFLVDHELALQAFVEHELAGDQARSLDAVAQLLDAA